MVKAQYGATQVRSHFDPKEEVVKNVILKRKTLQENPKIKNLPPNLMNAIVVAAGISQRYGDKNKLLEPYTKNKSILAESISQLSKVGGLDITVVLGHNAEEVRQHLRQYPIHFVENQDYKSGMVSSVKKGISSCENESPFIICLADMPNIKTSNYYDLIQNFHKLNQRSIMRPVKGAEIGNPVLFSNDLQDFFLSFDGKTKFMRLFQELGKYFKPYETSASCFFEDIDTQGDYRMLIQQGLRKI